MTKVDSDPSGELLGGKFRVGKQIGRGGMATVYAAEHVELGKAVAVKLLAAEYTTSRTITERFLREARAAAKIKSPYVCEVYDVGTFKERPFIVMELLKGESLYELLARVKRLSPEDTLQITTHVAKGLKKAHEMNVVHRDLKPENIFLTSTDDGGLLSKVVDFGLAKFYEPHQDAANARLTKEGALFGTPAYMSPEQARAKGDVDGRSDLWALGCIVFEMLTGRTVWEVEQGVAMILTQVASGTLPSATRFRPDLPKGFEAWFQRALARNVEERYLDADAFLEALKLALTSESGEPTAAGTSAPEVPTETTRLGVQKTPPAADPAIDQAAPPEEGKPRAGAGSGSPSSAQSPRPKARRWLLIWGAALAALLAALVGGQWALRQATTRAVLAPVERGDDAELVGEAQRLLFEGQSAAALEQFQAAFDVGQGKAARSLLTHTAVALDSPRGACALSGIGHPREFLADTESSKPLVLETETGLLVTWADSQGTEGRTQARVTLVDSALRRASPVVNVTPEATSVREPELFAVGQGLGLLYWDFAENTPGVYVRSLDARGHVAGAPKLLSSQVPSHPYYPAIAQQPDGSFWVVWVEPTRPRVHDLFVRKLSPSLEPLTKPVAITAYAAPERAKTQASRPSLQLSGDALLVAFTVRRNSSQNVVLLRVPLDQANAERGVEAAESALEGDDRFLGELRPLSPEQGKYDRPNLSCGELGCFVAWEEVPFGAHLSRLTAEGRPLSSQRISQAGSRPALALGPGGGLVSWYDSKDKRLKLAPFTPEAVGQPSVIGRSSSVLNQPPPQILRARHLVSAASTGGDWFVAWRGYEAAVVEPFLARVGCE